MKLFKQPVLSYRSLDILWVLFMMIALVGCATSQHHLASHVDLPIATDEHEEISISQIDVHAVESSLVVSGFMRRKYYMSRSIHGHVDVVAVNTQGSILGRVGVMSVPRIVPQRKAGRAYFKTKIPNLSDRIAELRIRFHQTTKMPDNEREFSFTKEL